MKFLPRALKKKPNLVTLVETKNGKNAIVVVTKKMTETYFSEQNNIFISILFDRFRFV